MLGGGRRGGGGGGVSGRAALGSGRPPVAAPWCDEIEALSSSTPILLASSTPPVAGALVGEEEALSACPVVVGDTSIITTEGHGAKGEDAGC